jgi:phosphatidylethanolamine/phosphatidyl-N-methylethanolamine N-methyltransferase
MEQARAVKESELFFRQWLRSPKSMGSIIPSSRALARAVAREVAWQPGCHVVELGGGTGAITNGLIEAGIPRDRLVVIELDRALYEYLRDRLEGVQVVQGDATRLDEILERLGVGEVSTVISGLPMVGMPLEFKRAIIGQGFAALGGRGRMLQYSYSPICPVPARELGIRARLVRPVPWNVPPAYVWRYDRLEG